MHGCDELALRVKHTARRSSEEELVPLERTGSRRANPVLCRHPQEGWVH